VEAIDMVTIIVTTMLLVAFMVLPLVWRVRADRRRNAADILRADVLSAVNRRLGGESMLSVDVIPETLGRPGRIVLWAPAGYEDLAETVWRDVVSRAPAGYDLVIRASRPRQAALSRAA
jgi:hypothetical protein